MCAMGQKFFSEECRVSFEFKKNYGIIAFAVVIEKSKDTIFIAKGNFRGNERIFGVKNKDRRQHAYVIGKSGTGKTTLLKNMVLQDIQAGRGLALIDPHGDFIEEVIEQIPAYRANDVVYFNPVDADYPMGFNVLEVSDARHKHLVVSDLLSIFTKIWANVWSARMEYILQNCIMALLDTPGTTLLGIPRILVDIDFRQRIIANVKDPVVRSFWVHEFDSWQDKFRNEAIVPIQNKVNQFLNVSFIRNIVGQPKSTLNVTKIMNEGKILLVNVAKGRMGEDNSQLLGAMIITKIQLAAMERVRIAEEDRADFFLYVDEFQNFVTESFASILSEARKYRLNLIIAHQYVGQLVTGPSTTVRDAVFGNIGTMICFRVGAADAEFLEKEFMPEFMGQDLINLPNHSVYVKLMVDGVTSRPFSASTLPPLKFETDPEIKSKIMQISRERYSRPRAEVEEKILKWSGSGVGEEVERKMHEAICWNCGKKAEIPFKPDGKRPVYCSNCLAQIQDGKLIPLPDRMPKTGPERFGASLGDLGIEFDPSKSAPSQGSRQDQPVRTFTGSRPGDRRDRQPDRRGQGAPDERHRSRDPRGNSGNQPYRQGDRPRGMASRPVIRGQEGVRPISLTQLASRDKEVAQGKPKVNVPDLKKVLEEAMKPHSAPQEKKEGVSQEKRVVNPGEVVKF